MIVIVDDFRLMQRHLAALHAVEGLFDLGDEFVGGHRLR